MESTLNVLDGIRDIEKAIGPDVSALETRAKTSISDKLAVGLVLEQTKGILNALSNDIKAKTNIVPENVITQTAKEVENMVVPRGISPLTPETMTASNVGGINDLAVRRNRAAISKLGQPQGQPTRRPAQGVTGLPNNFSNMATGARGGIVAFAEGELVEEKEDEAEDIESQLDNQDSVLVDAASVLKNDGSPTANIDQQAIEIATGDGVEGKSGEFKETVLGKEVVTDDGSLEKQGGILNKYKQRSEDLNKEIADTLERRKISLFGGPGVDPEMLSRISAAMADKKSFAGGVSAGGVAAAQFNEEQKKKQRELIEKKQNLLEKEIQTELDVAKEIYGAESKEVNDLRNFKLNVEKLGVEVAIAKDGLLQKARQLDIELAKLSSDVDYKNKLIELENLGKRIELLSESRKGKEENLKTLSALLGNMADIMIELQEVARDKTRFGDEAAAEAVERAKQFITLTEDVKDKISVELGQ